ncbi:MAG: NADH-quinone oxidoreductase subunit C [Actinomycetes bacterium]
MSDAPTDGSADAPTPEPTEQLLGAYVTRPRGELVLHTVPDSYRGLVEALRSDGYWLCVDLCAVDYFGSEADRGLPLEVTPERFEVVLNLIDPTSRGRVRLRCQVPADAPNLPTLFDIHPGTEALEREAFDLFGVVFDGHPDLSRILLPEDWEGHPLRRDADPGRIPVQFKAASNVR